MITLRLSTDKTIAYLEPCKPHGLFHQELSRVGGFFERKTQYVITLPLSSDAAKGLRSILTGKEVSLEDGAASVLATYADSLTNKEPVTVFAASRQDKAVVVATGFSITGYSALKRILANSIEIQDSIFIVSMDEAWEVSKKFPLANIDLSLSRAFAERQRAVAPKAPQEAVRMTPVASDAVDMGVIKAPEVKITSLPPFAGFDGTLASLRWVPLEAYEHIRKNTEKTSIANRRISEANKKAKSAKSQKKPQRSLNQKLTSMGVTSAFDLLHFFPLRHIDRSQPKLINQLIVGEDSAVLGTIVSVNTNYQKKYTDVTFEDMAQRKMSVKFFNQFYLSSIYKKGDQVVVSGKFSPFRGTPSFDSPKIDLLGSERSIPMIPVYPQSGKQEITTWDILELVKETLGRLGEKPLEEPFDSELLQKYRIPTRTDAYKDIHLPPSPGHFKDANRRLIYDELFRLQVMIQQRKADVSNSQGISHSGGNTATRDHWMGSLPYALTGAQSRAISEINEDMARPTPMHRLVQGDVGSGKSTLATATVINSLDNGYQAALLAPTEILAEQLFNGLDGDIGTLVSPRTGGVMNIQFLGGKTTAANARKIRASLADGTIDAVVGTHAILTPDTTFQNLGVAVIDEQHRFGVDQRNALREKRVDGRIPDMLSMTATPIPRSSSMVLYGDMDLTILDELPPGRMPIETIWNRIDAQEAIKIPTLAPWKDIAAELDKGHQAYVVASLVEDNERVAAQSVEDAYEKLSQSIFPGRTIGMVHGKQKRAEREEVMKSFAAGDIQILVATTVIEVGVNVPNSTVIVVLDPGRFGIAQLHQIRGRVGRSSLPSRCWLVGDTKTSEGEFRLNALVESTDGFYLSEKDLELRGEGTLFSTKQSGQGDLYLAKISEHMNVLTVAKSDVENLFARDPRGTSKTSRIFSTETEDIFGNREIKS